MSKEIELKAHVDDYEKLLNLLRSDLYIKYEGICEKFDIYFFNPILNNSFRVREQISNNGNFIKNTIFTVKDKIIDQGIEQNNEYEVELDYNSFSQSLTFFNKLGFKESHRKIKKGYSFQFLKYEKPLHIELLEVNNLGWFFEIEFIEENDINREKTSVLINQLYDTLEHFNIPFSNIEKRYYSQMILD